MRFAALTAILVLAANLAVGEEKPPFPVKWELSEGIEAPESAYFHSDSGVVFLSQIGKGGGKKKDGDGWISKLTPEGKMIKNRWVTGLNAPKGIRSHGGTLWVADIDTIVGIDIKSGKIIDKKVVDGAKFLNDVTCGADGAVYVADMVASRIYHYKNKKLSVFADGDDFESPNGLLVDGNRLLIGAWGLEIQDDFSTKKLGHLIAIDLKTKKRTLITKQPLGNLDGVELDGKGGYLVTDWKAGKVFHISAGGVAKTIIQHKPGTADHGYIVAKRLLILPRMLENKVTAYDLSSLKP